MKFRFVCATPHSQDVFYRQTLFGKWFAKVRDDDIELILYPENRFGLPAVYNDAIKKSCETDCILIFIHDDVFIADLFWKGRLFHSLDQYSVVGLVGNISLNDTQPSWNVKDLNLNWFDSKSLRGGVIHGSSFDNCVFDVFNQSFGQVEVIDGLFIAVKSNFFKNCNIFFDERFQFHMYDIDFCRQIKLKGFTLGVVDISVMHASAGKAGSDWTNAYAIYQNKWTENI